MKKLWLIFVFGMVAWVWHSYLDGNLFGTRNLSNISLSTDPCIGKKTCAVIYVAPWCPACKSISGAIREISKNAAKKHDLGLKVVVGQGRDASENENALSTYGYFARVDQDNSIFHKLGVTKFPSFYVLDSDGAKIVEDMDAFHWIQENFR